MTREEFNAAAKKGQGRAIIALRDGHFHPSCSELRRLVLRWPGFDAQLECSRGWYSVELMRASDFEAELTELVIQSLGKNKRRSRDLGHRAAIVHELAKRGSTAAREALYAHFSAEDDFWLAREVIDVDGLAGLDWVISRSSHLTAEDSWEFRWWLEVAEERCGKDEVAAWLSRESALRPEIDRFRAYATAPPAPYVSRAAPAPISYESFFKQLDQPLGTSVSAISWLASLDEAQLQQVWESFEAEEDPEKLYEIASELAERPQACNIARVVERARQWKASDNPFAMALEEVTDPRVRQLGLDLISDGFLLDGIGLLSNNAEEGDDQIVLAAVDELRSDEDLHSAGLDLLQIGRRLRSAQVLLWVYVETPCSFCRNSAVRDLLDLDAAPEALLKECLLDCDPDTRELARRKLAS